MSGFKMDRKLRTLVVGILAFALANSLQTSLAETQGECFAKITGKIANLELTEPLKVVGEITRKHIFNFMALLKGESPPNEYRLALEKIGPQKDCDKLLDEFEPIKLDECFDEHNFAHFLLASRLFLSSHVRNVYYAETGCENLLFIRKEGRAKCAAEVANSLVENIELPEPIKVFVEEMKNFEWQDIDELKRITPLDACNELIAAVEKMKTLDCYQINFSDTGENSRQRRYFEYDVKKISQKTKDVMDAKFSCVEARYYIELADDSNHDQDKSVDESDHDQDEH
jgi:hypothetical protein